MIMPEGKSNLPEANRVNSIRFIPLETKIRTAKLHYIRPLYISNQLFSYNQNIIKILEFNKILW